MTRQARNSSEPGDLQQCILDQIRQFGLTTVPAVVQTNGMNRNAVRSQCRRLVRSGIVFKLTLPTPTGPFAYYRTTNTEYREPLLRKLHAILCFCIEQRLPFRLLSGPQLAALAGASRLPKPCVLPRTAHTCRVGGGSGGNIGLVHLYHQADENKVNLNTVVAAIDRMVCESSFALWQWLAMAQRFTLVYLVAGEANAAELGCWLRRRPPVARVLAPPTPIAVQTHPAAPLMPTRHKDQSESLLDSGP